MANSLREKFLRGMRGGVREGVPMRELTSFRIGGEAGLLLRPADKGELATLLGVLHREGIPYWILGQGTNLLVPDEGLRRPVIEVPAGTIRRQGRWVTVGAGVKMARLLKVCAQWGLGGLEPLAGIPGTVGGAIRGNAGSGPVEIGERVVSLGVILPSGRRR